MQLRSYMATAVATWRREGMRRLIALHACNCLEVLTVVTMCMMVYYAEDIT